MKTKTVILAVGRPGAGKTTASDKIAARGKIRANVLHVEDYWDANNEHRCDHYGNHSMRDKAESDTWVHVKDLLSQYRGVLIIDMWLRDKQRRKEIILILRRLGVERIVCWHFVTPPEICKQRYKNRMSADDEDNLSKRISLGWHWDSLCRSYSPVHDDEVSSFYGRKRPHCFDEILEIDMSLGGV